MKLKTLLLTIITLTLGSGCTPDGGIAPAFESSATAPGVPRDAPSGSSEATFMDGTEPVICEPGTTRSCIHTIHQASGITSCWGGTQTCEEGLWQGCVPLGQGELSDAINTNETDENQEVVIDSSDFNLSAHCDDHGACSSAPTSFTEIYEANCSEDETPRWTQLHYKASTPEGSSTLLQVHAADTLAELVRGPALSRLQLGASENDVACNSLQDTGCVPSTVNFTANDTASASLLKVTWTLQPDPVSGNSPNIESWQLRYTCESNN